jgi:hypothetical protein
MKLCLSESSVFSCVRRVFQLELAWDANRINYLRPNRLVVDILGNAVVTSEQEVAETFRSTLIT